MILLVATFSTFGVVVPIGFSDDAEKSKNTTFI